MYSLRSSINENELTNRVRLLMRTPQHARKAIVLVEGIDDKKVYSRFFNPSKALIEECAGLGNLLKGIQQLGAENSERIIGIRDADYTELETIKDSPGNNLFSTDCHDVEMMMMSSDTTLKSILYEYNLSEEWNRIKDMTLRFSSFWGYTRWYNLKSKTTLTLPDHSVTHRFIRKKQPYWEQLGIFMSHIRLTAGGKRERPDITKLDRFITNHRTDELFSLCQGHDTVRILSVIINEYVGKNITNPNIVAIQLRASYSFQQFKETNLCKNIEQWQITYMNTILSV